MHLHPDLQERLARFLRELINDKKAIIIIATHSTAFLSTLEDYDDNHIELMNSGQVEIEFKKISNDYRKI